MEDGGEDGGTETVAEGDIFLIFTTAFFRGVSARRGEVRFVIFGILYPGCQAGSERFLFFRGVSVQLETLRPGLLCEDPWRRWRWSARSLALAV